MAIFKSFGENPSGDKINTLRRSSQYRNGSFQNFSPTAMMAADSSMMKMLWKFLNKPRNTAPPNELTPVKTNLKDIQEKNPFLIWFGHSSYFLRINGKNILVDPVLSGNASPFSFGAHSFPGSDAYTTEDLPDIDLLIITHDHYDHLDHRSIIKLKPKIRSVITSLGVGAHLISWGIDERIITELDWWESTNIVGGLELTATPARHFSGRTMKRNKTLWSSFVLQAGEYKIYIGADSGYDLHFKQIGEKFGPFDLAVLETGQYNIDWPHIHMMPEESVQASIDLKAKMLLPVHWAKFALAFHPWDEPVQRVSKKAAELNVNITTPQIGEPVILNKFYPVSKWWEKV